ncbi:pentatricopeptide repeat-containing protein At4g21065 isoform X1 [Selaginella moellendorffii]|uniref:pentatricopeptide repeat-containing protein At4g21065 isoform X1 n=2 Tax=Selaginella moellendorffii TaxID=88036 RepID=UPI000D1D0A05|nr:pentatricopeptide repeat-containing protein At4g21065 isoform X1 [Selaginella moellendorffii]|eukprot:XP_024520320.1 pentatricopeptide repeat-containing protein At4g21065 isoform X1 [Selaginella moellendorffii]
MDSGTLDRPRFLSNLLVDMYGKCGSLVEAKRVFDAMQHKNVFSWTMLMAGFVQSGRGVEAIQLFHLMCQEGELPDRVALLKFIDSCGAARALSQGRGIHSLLSDHTEFATDVMINNSLISMYGKFQELEEAKLVFDAMRRRDIVSWNAMIAAYAQNGYNRQAVEIFDELERQGGVMPDRVTFISTLDACAGLDEEEGLARGRDVHSKINEFRLDVDGSLATTLVNMYGRCGSFAEAKAIFDKMKRRDLICWNSMLSIYVNCGLARSAIQLFQEMDQCGVLPANMTFVAALDACSSLEALKLGREIHSAAASCGMDSDLVTANAIINMYGKCGSIGEAFAMFTRMPEKNVISWSTMIAAFCQNELADEALLFFKLMQQEGMELDRITYVSVLDAYTSVGALELGKALHVRIVYAGLDTSIVVGNTLVNMYGKCGSPDDARDVFDSMVEKNVVSWNAMLAAYGQNGRSREALALFDSMDVKPDRITFISVLDACASAAAGDRGKQIHATVNSTALGLDAGIQNALVHMYGKCGNLAEARRIFDYMDSKSVVSWTSMMTSYAQNGLVKESLRLALQMKLEGMRPNDITFVTILYCCSHSGKFKDAVSHFVEMRQDFGITPREAHFGCLIDMLGRSGKLEEAEELIQAMPIPADAVLWTSLLCACVTHKDEDRAARAAEEAFQREPKCAAAYIMLSNLYAALKKWDEAAKVRKRMEQAGVRKQAGRSWIEIDKQVHEFVAGDSIHPDKSRIFKTLQRLMSEMRIKGYEPDRKVVIHSMEEEEKDEVLFYHSEKLAVAFGIASTPPRTPLCIVENLRVCSDCHSAIKFISGVEGRRITVRDSNRFHHFDRGECSCGDYW